MINFCCLGCSISYQKKRTTKVNFKGQILFRPDCAKTSQGSGIVNTRTVSQVYNAGSEVRESETDIATVTCVRNLTPLGLVRSAKSQRSIASLRPASLTPSMMRNGRNFARMPAANPAVTSARKGISAST